MKTAQNPTPDQHVDDNADGAVTIKSQDDDDWSCRLKAYETPGIDLILWTFEYGADPPDWDWSLPMELAWQFELSICLVLDNFDLT